MRRLIAPVLACLALAGCAPPPTAYEVHIAPAWGDRTEAVLGALSDWTDAVGVRFRPVVTPYGCTADPGAWSGEGCFSITPEGIGAVKADCKTDATGCEHGDWIVVDDAEGAWRTGFVLRHEIGHALGLAHDTSKDAVMYRDAAGSATITQRDVQQYRAAR